MQHRVVDFGTSIGQTDVWLVDAHTSRRVKRNLTGSSVDAKIDRLEVGALIRSLHSHAQPELLPLLDGSVFYRLEG